MIAIDSPSDAISVAEGILLRTTDSRAEDEIRLSSYVMALRADDEAWDDDAHAIRTLIKLAKLLLKIGLGQLSETVVDMTLWNMELTDADQEGYPEAELWSELGALLSEHGDLVRARSVLISALNRSLHFKNDERPRIMANLSAVSLRTGDVRGARIWAAKALTALGGDWRSDLETRLIADRVRVETAKAGEDVRELQYAVAAFTESVGVFTERKGAAHPRVLAARTALTAARYRLASATHEVEQSQAELDELEFHHLNASLLLGLDHRETIAAQAALATAEFDAAGQAGSANSVRRLAAVDVLAEALGKAPATGAQKHSQADALRDALADMRASAVSDEKLPYLIERWYKPQENADRNDAKMAALESERQVIRLIAHAGASYLLATRNLFQSRIIQALERGVRFHVIISSPWNSLAVFMRPDAATERASFQNILKLVETSKYYQETYKPVTESYLKLKEKYPRLIELRLTSMDISGTTLLTSGIGFFEPYITSNPEHRTGRGLNAFEVMFYKDSRYHADSLAEFETQWNLSSTWEQFENYQGRHRATLVSEMDALADVQVRGDLRAGGEPRP
ncbi:hypothetical protein ACIP79_27775 [Streptomyces sp. NPDC088747]|uniref:hypothetical protein n=1 Tax=Streptomyces sp. NPDC088747 TaxID=3365886 RepID=UPI003812C095